MKLWILVGLLGVGVAASADELALRLNPTDHPVGSNSRVTTSAVTTWPLALRLNPTDHPVGTRLLSLCRTSAGTAHEMAPESTITSNTFATATYIIRNTSDRDPLCFTERAVQEWAPSGTYVLLVTRNGKTLEGGWYKTAEFAALEILPAPPAGKEE